jgi:hypothetical protein
VKNFMRFAGIRRPEEFHTETRAHLIAWRDEQNCRADASGSCRSSPAMPLNRSRLAQSSARMFASDFSPFNAEPILGQKRFDDFAPT